MSIVTQQNITQNFLSELSSHSAKATFTPFNKIAEALKFLEEKGIPNNKVEDYKYCNVEAIIRKDFKTLTNSFSVPDKKFIQDKKNKNALNIVVINGKLSESESDLDFLPPLISILPIEKAAEKFPEEFQKYFGTGASEKKDAFIAMNTAFAGSGIYLHAKQNAVLEKPVQIIYIDEAKDTAAHNCRNLFIVDHNAQINISEHFTGGKEKGKIFSNHVAEIFVGENAIVQHQVIQERNENSFGIYTTQLSQDKQSNYTINTFSFSGSLIRNNLNIVVNGQRAETHLNGLSVTNGTQLVDNHTLVDHAKANCESSELYKGIAGGKSNLTFNGKIFVRRDSQKINAYQSSKNILMSDDATVNTKPQLEIFANDVKCSHGTSTGKVDEDAMFYLKSRGIGEEKSKKLLLHAFAAEVLNKVKNEELKVELAEKLEVALGNL